jgi:hypothetical protein
VAAILTLPPIEGVIRLGAGPGVLALVAASAQRFSLGLLGLAALARDFIEHHLEPLRRHRVILVLGSIAGSIRNGVHSGTGASAVTRPSMLATVSRS